MYTMRHTRDLRAFPFPIVIADIGGTNARFAVLTDQRSEISLLGSVKTGDYATLEEVVQRIVLEISTVRPRSAVLVPQSATTSSH